MVLRTSVILQQYELIFGNAVDHNETFILFTRIIDHRLASGLLSRSIPTYARVSFGVVERSNTYIIVSCTTTTCLVVLGLFYILIAVVHAAIGETGRRPKPIVKICIWVRNAVKLYTLLYYLTISYTTAYSYIVFGIGSGLGATRHQKVPVYTAY